MCILVVKIRTTTTHTTHKKITPRIDFEKISFIFNHSKITVLNVQENILILVSAPISKVLIAVSVKQI